MHSFSGTGITVGSPPILNLKCGSHEHQIGVPEAAALMVVLGRFVEEQPQP